MKRQPGQIIFITVIGLAVIGLLTTSAWKLLQMVGMIALFAVIFYFLFRFLQKRNGSWNNKSQYKRAVKQSRKRYQPKKTSSLVKKPASPINNKRKSNAQLTVIEGKKNNKKRNRALH